MADSEVVRPKGWFVIEGQEGDRTIDQQMRGLGPLLAQVQGKSVLDVGCAEGLVSIELAKAGAKIVRGFEICQRYIPVGTELALGLPCHFEHGDANTFEPGERFDIVIMLAVLHKLKNPTEACARYADLCNELCVIRLPPLHAPVVIDERSNNNPHHIGNVMEAQGFALESIECGPFDEWTGYFRRR